jgi:23S rRNA (cytosine1962-C5)-methyltransferase
MVRLRRGRGAVIERLGHPWVYSQAIESASEEARSGALSPVVSQDSGTTLGWGFYSPGSLIGFRFVSRGEDPPPATWLEDRLRSALQLRRRLEIPSNAFRLVNSEGDGLPGLVVDVYDSTTVLRPLIRGVEAQADGIVAALRELLPENSVYLRKDETAARKEQLRLPTGYLHGSGDAWAVIREGQCLFRVDLARGQKTGFYLDQRDNHLLLRGLARELRVLNLFSYTGAFALQAAEGGARAVVSVESSAAAVELSRQNERLNRRSGGGTLEWVQGDAFGYLEDCDRFDLIVVDPPPFARRRSEVRGALRGYGALNRLAALRLSPGGLLMSFSCSSAVTEELMLGALREAIRETGREAQILRRLHAAPDHPVRLGHPEGEYLKGWLLRVL